MISIATWIIRLDAECPHCQEIVDLLDCDEILSDGLMIGEHGTEASVRREVYCPLCGGEFEATLTI